MDRPITTLFMLMSVDGKISIGAIDSSLLRGNKGDME